MKVIHIADIHWRGLSRHDEYKESFSEFFKKAKSLNPDVIYVGGDIVHSKTQGISPELIDSLCWWFSNLADIAPTHVILGNHDGLVLNSDRQDAISPILDALNNSNIYLYKDSGVYPVNGHDNFNWCVFSCFDEPGWEKIKPEKGKINIALFHGAVWGSKTDIDWEIDGDVTDDFFNSFDFALLGDIHKKQFLNDKRTMAYPGSTIQQNYGEDTGKGFLFWDIEDKQSFTVEFHEIPHKKPFITIDWRGSVNKTVGFASRYPNGSRFRIKSKNVLTHADSKQIQNDLQIFKAAEEVVFKADATFDSSKIKTSIGSLSKKNLRDAAIHKKLIREYYSDTSIPSYALDEFDSLIDLYMSQITDQENILRNSRWQIHSLKFNNLFSYGSGNFINFENISGVTGIFGKNTRGKSSIVGALMYCLFNTTDRGSVKNIHIINSRKNNCEAIVDLTINGEMLRVKRSTVKHQTRKGDVYASTALSLFKIDQAGNVIEDLTEEQRRETEKVLRKLIGTSDDFLMTSLASQGGMNTFINEGATSRKMILTKFLDLGVFETMYEKSKAESSEIRSKIKSYPDIDWDEMIDELDLEICNKNKDIEDIANSIQKSRNTLSSLNIDLATSDTPDIVTESEYNDQKEKVEKNNILILGLEKNREKINLSVSSKNETLNKITTVLRDFPIDELKEKLIIQKDLERSIIELQHKNSNLKIELDRQKRSASKLNDVPCGDTFPSCMFIKDSHHDKKLIDNQANLVNQSIDTLEDIKISLSSIIEENIQKKIDKFDALEKRKSEILIEISQIKISLNNASNDIDISKRNMNSEIEKLNDMSSRLVMGADDPSSKIRSNIILLKEKIKNLDEDRIKILEKVAESKILLEKYTLDKKDFEKMKKKLKVYDLFMQSVSRKGIPLQIMMSQLPIINSEISKILHGVTGFTVDLEANPDSNAMDIFINYGDSRRVIELASGMEKMMSSLAIRVALINVSSLTKTNTLIIDEGFGALDEANIEACSRLLESLKTWFKNILVISHVDAIKDAVDNSLEITKNGKDSKVYSI